MTQPLTAPGARVEDDALLLTVTSVSVVVPVYNEELALAGSIERLHSFLTAGFPFTWRIVIADNASTDATPRIARSLARRLAGVSVMRLEQKGRGRALRAVWSARSRPVSARPALMN